MRYQFLRPSGPLTVVLIGAAFAALAVAPRVNAKVPQTPATSKTTKDGVYSAAQAIRGEQTYMDACVSCHPPDTHKGATFRSWQGYTLQELVAYLTESMPETEPGSLTPKEYTQVVAFLLKINGMPAGPDELPTDPAQLRAITINLLPGRPLPSHHP